MFPVYAAWYLIVIACIWSTGIKFRSMAKEAMKRKSGIAAFAGGL
jgi:hypothetical protein